jgi:hypothetical protein
MRPRLETMAFAAFGNLAHRSEVQSQVNPTRRIPQYGRGDASLYICTKKRTGGAQMKRVGVVADNEGSPLTIRAKERPVREPPVEPPPKEDPVPDEPPRREPPNPKPPAEEPPVPPAERPPVGEPPPESPISAPKKRRACQTKWSSDATSNYCRRPSIPIRGKRVFGISSNAAQETLGAACG